MLFLAGVYLFLDSNSIEKQAMFTPISPVKAGKKESGELKLFQPCFVVLFAVELDVGLNIRAMLLEFKQTLLVLNRHISAQFLVRLLNVSITYSQLPEPFTTNFINPLDLLNMESKDSLNLC